jgi:hypothetical protein
MKAAGYDFQPLRLSCSDDAIDDAMFGGKATGPPSRQVLAQRLGFPDTTESGAPNFCKQSMQPINHFLIAALQF